jgi:hypothetical protein
MLVREAKRENQQVNSARFQLRACVESHASGEISQSILHARGHPLPRGVVLFPSAMGDRDTNLQRERKKENILAQQERLLGTYLAPKYGSNCTTAQTLFGRRDVRQVGHEYKDEIAAQTGLISPPPSSLQTLN